VHTGKKAGYAVNSKHVTADTAKGKTTICTCYVLCTIFFRQKLAEVVGGGNK